MMNRFVKNERVRKFWLTEITICFVVQGDNKLSTLPHCLAFFFVSFSSAACRGHIFM